MNNLIKKILSFPNPKNKKLNILLGFILVYIYSLSIDSNNTIWRFQPFKVMTTTLGYGLGLTLSEESFTDLTLDRYEYMLPALKILLKTMILAISWEISIRLVLFFSGLDITPYVKIS